MPRTKPPAQAGSGSPPVGEPVYLVVGRLRRPHGLRGEILMEVLTDFPERLKRGKQVFIGDDYTPHTISACRRHNDGLLLTFEGCTDRDEAAKLRNQDVFVPTGSLPALSEGEYYHHQLVGLSVVTDTGRSLGALVEVIETGANDVYAVRDENGREVLLPAIPQVVLDVDLDSATMRVHPLEGLLDE
ncbi:MAG: ribosome maturation factor RimM [Chloroflexota bacterium]